ncbi:nitroimidazol reductase NimA-like FMN-containing flavoprotein (pyridoxamine 5'-phosphate oxidase superfamily) [Rhodoglobus vestalii]|uniref:Nitroimidazol reductase NimA-like FMN-containing flavoprotein (Pyridoxamine 5'-phosphate oxidase superfamily) n=1 Tax=Rhodoglobus vestalii TaxID=193384 RepID=A0A8H2K511_9MICO|nr:pyridoxamine 5'-phosphate oxidase family protein [Rhodoglobus vestalii]TQO19295.1 nitroimidazol reductase NimA-like FMN-containing flavoprotein (pyridoxamine 5'-phosphate oxidase superfamily) [Rhodoglobus vestalii]
MSEDLNDPVEELELETCWELLRTASFGRIAVSFRGEPEITPVNFIAFDNRLLMRTAQGTKLLKLTINDKVALETDSVGAHTAWSVVVKGTARAIESQDEIYEADKLPLHPLIPTLKYVWVEITPTEVSGRRFTLGPEPERY